MTRLDRWLVEEGHFSSRQTAKRGINSGHILVNGQPAKPSTDIDDSDSVRILSDYLDYPLGFEKLRRINDSFGSGIIQEGDMVLDIGSSAGGFLLYCSKIGANCIGIEISDSFAENLLTIAKQYDNISVVIGDAFSIDPKAVCSEGELETLLIDVTTKPDGTLRLAQRYARFLKDAGWLVLAIKMDFHQYSAKQIHSKLVEIGFSDIKALVLSDSKHEFHIIARRH